MMRNKRKIRVGKCEVSVNAQELFESKTPDRKVESVIEESVIIKIDDDYGEKEYSPAFFNEDENIVMPLRNRENENGWGIPTVLDENKVDIVGNFYKCFECDKRCHSNRDLCHRCGNELVELSPFFWRGIEITVHCQIRAIDRLDTSPSNVKQKIESILKDSVFVSFSDNHEGETVCLLNESESSLFPLRNRKGIEGVGITTVIDSGYEKNLSDDEFCVCDFCGLNYHKTRDSCPSC